jgi:hypothetical protein
MKAMMAELLASKPTPILESKEGTGSPPPKANPFPLLVFDPAKDKSQEEGKLGDTGTSSPKGKDSQKGEDV